MSPQLNPANFYLNIGKLIALNGHMIERNQKNPHLLALLDLDKALGKVYEVSHLVDCPFDDDWTFIRRGDDSAMEGRQP